MDIKNILGMIFIFLISVSFVIAEETSTDSICTDSDGGLDYYVKGMADNRVNAIGSWWQDKCLSLDPVTDQMSQYNEVYECEGSNCNLQEGYCIGDSVSNIAYSCPNGCRDGACIEDTQECTYDADCPSVTRNYCSGDNACSSTSSFRCDSGKCVVAGGGAASCMPCVYGCNEGACINQEGPCTDSDGGRDYYKYGKVINIRFEGGEDYCWEGDGWNLAEYFCSGTDIKAERFNCPNGCQDGACIKEQNCNSFSTMNTCLDDANCYWDQQYDNCRNYDSTKQTCSDPDNGKNYYIQAHTFGFRTYSSAEDPSRDLRIRTGGKDACIGSKLREHYCNNDYYIGTIDTTCPNGCSNGACITDTTQKFPPFIIAVADNAPASDVILISKINVEIKFDKYEDLLITTRLFGEVDALQLNNMVTLAVFHGGAVIIVGDTSPADHVILAVDLAQVLKNLGVGFRTILSSEVKSSNLRDLFKIPTSKPVCGNNICEAGEADDCPVCIEGERCSLRPCFLGTCPQDCERIVCKDSDGGNNHYVKGTAYYVFPEGTIGTSKGLTDKCIIVRGFPETYEEVESCEGSQCFLNEATCKDGNPYAWSYTCPYGCRDGACIQSIGGIYAYLNKKFELVERQSAKVVDYKNMKIILNDIIEDGTTRIAGDIQTTSVGGAGGGLIALKPIGARIQVEMPSDCIKSSYNEGCTSSATNFVLKVGESREIFDIQIKLLELSPNKAVFIVTKSIQEDYIDVFIEPEVNTIEYGDYAKYEITVIDKHQKQKCILGEVCVAGWPVYTYQIVVRNLPFLKEHTKQITLNPEEKKSFTLVVRPYQVVEVAREEAIAEEGISPREATQKTAVAKAISVSEKVSRIEKIAITGRAVATTEAVETKRISTGVIKPIEVKPYYSREYKFNVRASLLGNPQVHDTAYAVLRIKPRISIPPPPTEEVTIKLYKGWNLISLPGKLVRFIDNDCISNRKLIAFVYLKEKQKYVSLQEAQRILGSGLKEYLAKNAFWIYSYGNCKLTAKIDLKISYSGINLYEGWNLIPITEDMVGGYLTDILGDCDLEKTFLWEAEKQKWKELNLEYSFSEYQHSYGFLVKSKDYCRLGGQEIIAPPPMPE